MMGFDSAMENFLLAMETRIVAKFDEIPTSNMEKANMDVEANMDREEASMDREEASMELNTVVDHNMGMEYNMKVKSRVEFVAGDKTLVVDDMFMGEAGPTSSCGSFDFFRPPD